MLKQVAIPMARANIFTDDQVQRLSSIFSTRNKVSGFGGMLVPTEYDSTSLMRVAHPFAIERVSERQVKRHLLRDTIGREFFARHDIALPILEIICDDMFLLSLDTDLEDLSYREEMSEDSYGPTYKKRSLFFFTDGRAVLVWVNDMPLDFVLEAQFDSEGDDRPKVEDHIRLILPVRSSNHEAMPDAWIVEDYVDVAKAMLLERDEVSLVLDTKKLRELDATSKEHG